MTINVTNITFTIMINVTTVTKGEEGETFFFIEEGQARVMMSRADGEENQQVIMIFLICALGFEFWMICITLHRLVGIMLGRINIV